MAVALSLALGTASASADDYSALVAKAEQGGAVDYTQLRLAYAQSPGYDPYGAEIEDPFDAAWKAFRDKDCRTALERTDEVLKRDYTRIAAHAIREECFQTLGEADAAARERVAGKGLLKSVLESGDGQSAKSAFVVVTLDEENFVLLHFGVSKDEQALVNDSGHPYDVIKGVQKGSNEPAAVWFDVSNLFMGMARRLAPDETSN